MTTTLDDPTTPFSSPFHDPSDRMDGWNRNIKPQECPRTGFGDLSWHVGGTTEAVNVHYLIYDEKDHLSKEDTISFEGPACVGTRTTATQSTQLLSIKEKVDYVRDGLSIPMKNFAEAMRCTRASVYGWRKGVAPHKGHRERLETLKEIADEWASLSTHSLGSRVHEKNEKDVSLMDLLSSEEIDRNAVTHLLGQWADRLNDQKSRLASQAQAMRQRLANRGIDRLPSKKIGSNYRRFAMRSTED